MSDSYDNDMADRSERHSEADETNQPAEPQEQMFEEHDADLPETADEPGQDLTVQPDNRAETEILTADERLASDEPLDEAVERQEMPSADQLIVQDVPVEAEPAMEEPTAPDEMVDAPEGELAVDPQTELLPESAEISAARDDQADEPDLSGEPEVSSIPETVAGEHVENRIESTPAPAPSPEPPNTAEPEPRLSHDERTALNTIAAGSGVQARQARIILDWGSGRDAGQIARELKLSENTVARNIRAFQAKRMESFAEAPAPAQARRGKSRLASPRSQPDVRITVEDLCHQYDVDMRHATHVAELAHQLFALTLPLHQLDERYLDVIYVAGLLHNIAYASDPKKHHTRRRDIILATPLSNINDADRALVAVATAFHRKAWSQDRLQKEKSYLALPTASQQVALWLSAILRIADGLDYSQSQSTGLTESMIGRDICLIGVKGPHDKIDRSRANTKADMWRTVTGISLSVGSRKDVRQALRRRMPHRPDPAVVTADGTMSETGRALLSFHFQRMLYHEPGARSGISSEPVHDMRVAVRRTISALDVFGGSYKGKVRRWMLRDLRVLEDMLGGVRDLDVNIVQAETYLETLPWEARPDLEQMIIDWKDLRDNNRSRLLRYLDSPKYAEFAERMLTFCETPDADLARSADSPSSLAVGHAAPAVIYLRYEAIRAYEPVIADVPIATLHEVRGEAKRMRYVLEFFRDALGPEARDLIELFVRVQDHLGALQDADIACGFIQKYIKREVKKARQEGQNGEVVDISTRLYGINAYLDSRQNQIEAARKSFAPLWAEVISPETRQMFARTVGVL